MSLGLTRGGKPCGLSTVSRPLLAPDRAFVCTTVSTTGELGAGSWDLGAITSQILDPSSQLPQGGLPVGHQSAVAVHLVAGVLGELDLDLVEADLEGLGRGGGQG